MKLFTEQQMKECWIEAQMFLEKKSKFNTIDEYVNSLECDKLYSKIEPFYNSENEPSGDLTDIGEITATHFGFL